MTVSGMKAWVTSAVEEQDVKKAILLALSLRRVSTAKKLVVLATATLSQISSEKLQETFDQVVFLKTETPNGLSLEDYAKVEAFSLLISNKCVYLSPNTVILKNCDDIFEKYDNFAAWGIGKWLDSSVYLFTPSLESSRALRKISHLEESLAKNGNVSSSGNGKAGGGWFAKCFNLWIQEHTMPNWEKLDVKYNAILDLNLNGGGTKSLSSKVTIANFGDGPHPLDFVEGGVDDERRRGWGPIENLVVDLCVSLFEGGVNPNLDTSFRQEPYKSEPIAIVGMSFRLPGGNNPDEFWDLLVNGKEAIKPLPDFRWKREPTHIPCQNRNVEAGFLTTPVDEFDGTFFGISGKEAEVMDPQHRLLLEVAWEAFEDAMIDPLSIRGTQTGIFVGSWLHDYRDMIMGTTDMEFFRRYMGTSIAAGAARLSHFLGTTGPSISTESGCSSAMGRRKVSIQNFSIHFWKVSIHFSAYKFQHTLSSIHFSAYKFQHTLFSIHFSAYTC